MSPSEFKIRREGETLGFCEHLKEQAQEIATSDLSKNAVTTRSFEKMKATVDLWLQTFGETAHSTHSTSKSELDLSKIKSTKT